MTSLAHFLEKLIRGQGPISVSRYMEEALGNEDYGYYKTHDPLGRRGDFITAPEISQMFGELIGLWCAETWRQMNSPDPVHLIELGPGHGTLMSDLWRSALQVAPSFVGAAKVHMVEFSALLVDKQKTALSNAGIKNAVWHGSFDDVEPGPFILVANEFFDALPIRQFIKSGDDWLERLISVADEGKEPHFKFVTSNLPSENAWLVPEALCNAPAGSVVEVNPRARSLAGDIAERLARHGGAALVIDYGPAQSAVGDSLQAARDHKHHPVLMTPGEADLTAHVDFAALIRSAKEKNAATWGPLTQSQFLQNLGLQVRARALMDGASPKQQLDVMSAVQKLIHPDHMGDLFKAIALTGVGQPTPPGFGQ